MRTIKLCSFRRQNTKAVAMIFYLMIVGFVLSFLMMVVNTGMIIHQKMKLQASVDLAAYAGASVQASYFGNAQSFEGEESIVSINNKIMGEYQQLIEDINEKPQNASPPPILFPDPASCSASCVIFNKRVGDRAVEIYDRHRDNILKEHAKVKKILKDLPEKIQEAAEATMAMNIPELDVNGNGPGGFGGSATNNPATVMGQATYDDSALDNKRNAVLTFSSDKGAYLANVVGSVPHSLVYYGIGNACVPWQVTCATTGYVPILWYCPVNGQGGSFIPQANCGQIGFTQYLMAVGAWQLAQEGIGNIGQIPKLNSSDSAIPLQVIENPHRPKPFTVVAAEWYPENGSFMNMENSLGATGSLFPKQTRLAAVSLAQPFGSSFARFDRVFGVRLAGIRKNLLDPTTVEYQEDYGDLFPYMQSLAPHYSPNESAEQVIQRFLH